MFLSDLAHSTRIELLFVELCYIFFWQQTDTWKQLLLEKVTCILDAIHNNCAKGNAVEERVANATTVVGFRRCSRVHSYLVSSMLVAALIAESEQLRHS